MHTPPEPEEAACGSRPVLKYHYVITLRSSYRGREARCCYSGIADVHPGTTRNEVYQEVLRATKEKMGSEHKDSVVVFWSLENNELG